MISDTRDKIVALLIEAGHSPDKALEIAIDAGRGDYHAKQWIKKARKAVLRNA